MAKKADRYFQLHPWKVIEDGYNPDYARTAESVFSLANEYMGVRGYLEEADAPMRGVFLNGVYAVAPTDNPGYKGFIHKTHYMTCGADLFRLTLVADGEAVMPQDSDFCRELDMKTGCLTRRMTVQTPCGARLTVETQRLLSMRWEQLAAQRVTLSSDRPCHVRLEMDIDPTVRHQGMNRLDWHEAAGQPLTFETNGTDFGARYAQEGETRFDGVIDDSRTFEKTVRVLVRRPGEAFPAEQDMRAFDELLAANRAHYDDFWAAHDIEIEGSPEDQQGIRFCIFHLHQTYRGLDGRNNIGAKGLTGEAYNGHAFWDSETYCLPYYLLNDRQAAKNLLMFRWHTLAEAKERAKDLDCEGACYPIATLNGEEACSLWQHASLQMQPSTAVAYGVWLYVTQTGDDAFLKSIGVKLLIEVSRYLATRGSWDQTGTRYGFWGVMGPDEFHLMVNNNYYTNFMGKKTFEYTLQAIRETGDTSVSASEQALWAKMARCMALPQREDLVFPQHDGYFDLPHTDIQAIAMEEFPLYSHWSYDRIYRTDMIKQPDVLMTMFLYPGDFTMEELAANYDYYEPRCIHESSLSPSIHSILASMLGRRAAAKDFFGFATRLDLDNYNRNTCEGLHLTSIAAAWITIVSGFGGLTQQGQQISLNPWLPQGWEAYSFQILVGESRIKAIVTDEGTSLILMDGPAVTVTLNGEKVEVRA